MFKSVVKIRNSKVTFSLPPPSEKYIFLKVLTFAHFYLDIITTMATIVRILYNNSFFLNYNLSENTLS